MLDMVTIGFSDLSAQANIGIPEVAIFSTNSIVIIMKLGSIALHAASYLLMNFELYKAIST